MFRQSPSRSQRTRGIKVKHVLQICFLVAVCFWLLYQVKHSHDKKKELDETDMKNSQQTRTSSEVVKLGRKDLLPKVEETDRTSTKQDEETEEAVGEEEEIKNDEEEHADDNRSEEKEDEGGGDGDDEMDEHGDDKPEDEVDHEEDVTEEEKKDEIDEKENEEIDSEDKRVQVENDSSSREQDDDDEKAHEAREEHYKADDASSAVTHESEDNSAKNENRSSGNSNELTGENVEQSKIVVNTENNDVAETTSYSKTEDREMSEKVGPFKANVRSASENGSALDHLNQINNKTEASADGLPAQDRAGTESENITTGNTAIGDDSALHTIPLDQGKNYSLSSNDNHTDSTRTASSTIDNPDPNSGEASKANNNTVSTTSNRRADSSEGAEENSTYSTMQTNGETKAEKSGDNSDGEATGTDKSGNGSDGAIDLKVDDPSNAEKSGDNSDGEATETDKSANNSDRTIDESVDDPSNTENAEEVQNDTIDSSDSSIGLVEKEVRTDLDTLPEIQMEVSQDDDAAAE